MNGNHLPVMYPMLPKRSVAHQPLSLTLGLPNAPSDFLATDREEAASGPEFRPQRVDSEASDRGPQVTDPQSWF
jgi:hypothetical protein